jgi:hypothetical protein
MSPLGTHLAIAARMKNVACQPMAHHIRGVARAARRLGCSSVVLGVAAYLASVSPACAQDTATPAKPRAKATSSAMAPRVPLLPPRSESALLLPVVERNRATARVESASEAPGVGATAVAIPPAPSSIDSGSEGESCEGDCPPKRKSPMSLLPEVILRNLNEVPLLAVFIMPVTEGVTITPAEGLPAVTFTVKPTKFTRGSGLVAVSRF